MWRRWNAHGKLQPARSKAMTSRRFLILQLSFISRGSKSPLDWVFSRDHNLARTGAFIDGWVQERAPMRWHTEDRDLWSLRAALCGRLNRAVPASHQFLKLTGMSWGCVGVYVWSYLHWHQCWWLLLLLFLINYLNVSYVHWYEGVRSAGTWQL